MSGRLCLNCTDLLKPAAVQILWSDNTHQGNLWLCFDANYTRV